ncbi:MAG: tRNA (N(6)-L-threonylcarbamoyladenosine(37)-C(2))-methylthiotransferase MtaB [Coprococcus sp.]
MLKGKSVAALTLGCKTNQYETDAMMEILENAGARQVPFEEKADIYIINTCSVTNMADKKSRQMIHRARKANPDAIVVACGCYVQAQEEKLKEDTSLDIIVGNNKKKDIADIIETYMNENKKCSVLDISAEKEYEEIHISKVSNHTRAYVKIQDGCNQFCTYCIIPYIRGRIRSRDEKEIIAEIEALAASGVKEVVLTGIHISSYGKDKENGIYLADLVECISKIKAIKRIRLGSLEPNIITEEFVARMSKNPKVCPHFHLSLQSGCNAVLKRMNRKYTCEEYLEKCELLRRAYDRPAITTDVIVGFPGETDEEFQQTLDYLTKLNLYEMHIFKYSPRQGTIAADMPGQVSPDKKNIRSDELLKLSERNKESYERSFTGEELQVLVEEIIKKEGKTYLRGHTERYMCVDIETGEKNAEAFINSIVYTEYTKDEDCLII